MRVSWCIVAAALLFAAVIPVQLQAQWLIGGVLLVALLVAYGMGRRAVTLRAQALWRLVIIVISTFLALRYIQWRATETLPLQFGLVSMVCGLLLLLAEFYGLVNMLFGFFINSAPFQRRSVPLPADEDALPHVDVYIPTYNEDPAIVRPSVIAATQMRYPAYKLHVHILDDGGTAQKCNDADPVKAAAARKRAHVLKDIAQRYGAGYLTRERNLHAKAGNINSALKSTRGDLVLVLDCDHIPTRDFLQRTVGFFVEDPKLFVLQTPHNFVSPDPVERNLDTYKQSPAENELFYDVMQPGLDFWGTSFFCGSAAVLRRSVIDQLGGVSGKTITEDAETTLDALSLGYRSAYYNRPMVSGLQPETFSGFIVQRVRWGQGMWQIFLLKNPWKQPRLRLVQRLLYTNFAFYWGFAFARVVMLLAPPAYLVFGVNLADTTADQLVAYAGPALAASLVSTQFFYGRVRWPFMSQLYEILQSLYVLRGLAQVVRKPSAPTFKVTPKGETLDGDFISSLAWPFYLFLTITVVAVCMAGVRYDAQPWNRGAIAFVTFWAVLDMVLLLAVLGITLERRQLRAEPRALCEEPVLLTVGDHSWNAHCTDASASGVGLRWASTAAVPEVPTGGKVRIDFPERDGASIEGELLNTRWVSAGIRAAGVRYRMTCLADERLAVDLAFGSSKTLVMNNARRRERRSIVRGLQQLGSFALRQGLDHLAHLYAHRRRRHVAAAARWLNPFARKPHR